MAFTRENLSIVTNNVKSGVVSAEWNYFNEDNDTVTTASFFSDYRLRASDIINVISSTGAIVSRFYVASVTDAGVVTLGGGTDIVGLAGAVSVLTELSTLVTVGAIAITLADGIEGQKKTIVMTTDGGTATLTPAHFGNGTTLAFADVYDTVQLVFTTGKWYVTSLEGAVVG